MKDDFDALLVKRDLLEEAHADWCSDAQGLPESSYEAQQRDKAWKALEAVQAQIDAEIAAEAV